SLAAISKPGLAGSFGANSAFAVKLVISNTRQVASTAPRILLISKESISDQAPGRKVELGRAAAEWEGPGSRLSQRTPRRPEISVCPCSGNPYKRAGFRQPPPIRLAFSARSR